MPSEFLQSLRRASFRGVEFFIESIDTTLGRRNVLHEYPKQDVPYAEDMGKKAREISVRAYVLQGLKGESYQPRRDELIRAIESKKEPGILVHPTLGSMLVIPKDCRHGFSNQEGGIEYFDVSFVEAGQNKYPDSTTVDTGSQVSTAANKAMETIKDVFGNLFNISNVPQFLSDDASSILIGFVNELVNVAGIRASLSAESSNLLAAVDSFKLNLSTYLMEPPTVADEVATLTSQIQGLFNNPADAYLAYKNLYYYGDSLPTINETTTTRRQQAQNQRMLIRLTKAAAIQGMAESAKLIEFPSYDEASAIRDELADLIDDQILAIGATDEDNTYTDLNGLRASVALDITSRAANLERIKIIQNQTFKPALVQSYSLYDTANRADEIVARNKVKHPGFLPAGVPLQVLI